MSKPDPLLACWGVLWREVSVIDGEPIFLDLVARYAEPHRAYHTLEHISECLTHLDMVRHSLARPLEVELALWFHDAIYDPRRGDNEEQSALLAKRQLRAAGVDDHVAARVADLIRLTNHAQDGLTGDAAVLGDIDLAILGAEPGRFARYDAAIRQEYDWVPDPVYRVERGRVLAGFLARPRIYHIPFFFAQLEKPARANLTTALQQLHSFGTGDDR